MQEILQAIGLSPDEITVYEYLLTNGAKTAGDVSRQTSIKRGTSYNVLGDLVAKGFVRQVGEADGKGIMKFALEHPGKIKEVIESERAKKEEAMRAFESALPALTSRWNLVYHRPAVRSMEGIEGLRNVYSDIINSGSDILLIRSIFDDKHPEVDRLVAKQILAQVERGIQTRALTPASDEAVKNAAVVDEGRNVIRRLVPENEFSLPAQVIVYGDKVALTSYKGEMITTLIENEAIAETFRAIFEFMWSNAWVPGAKQTSLRPSQLDTPGSETRLV